MSSVAKNNFTSKCSKKDKSLPAHFSNKRPTNYSGCIANLINKKVSSTNKPAMFNSTISHRSHITRSSNHSGTWVKPSKLCSSYDHSNVKKTYNAVVASNSTDISFSDSFHLLQHSEFKIMLSKISEITAIICNNLPTKSKLVQILSLFCC